MVKPLVSISCITYNHGSYIRACLEGFLIQQTTFDYEILIHDDASTDNTAIIIKEYEDKYPNIIKPIYQLENQYSQGKRGINVRYNFPRAKGKYIAMCEGDDYWTDPLKLQKQVDFLESNSNFVMSFHAVDVKNEIEGVNYQYPIPPKEVLKFKDLLFKHYIPTCSLVFARSAMPDPMPKWFYKCLMGDIPLELLIADKGLTKFFDEEMGVYRKNIGGVTVSNINIDKGRQAYLYVYRSLKKHFNGKHSFWLSLIVIKVRLGYIKDRLGLNPSLKKHNV